MLTMTLNTNYQIMAKNDLLTLKNGANDNQQDDDKAFPGMHDKGFFRSAAVATLVKARRRIREGR